VALPEIAVSRPRDDGVLADRIAWIEPEGGDRLILN
jgi:hypothetical protein